MQKDVERIRAIIDEVKRRYTTFGGDVEFMDLKDDKVRIRTVGYCHR